MANSKLNGYENQRSQSSPNLMINDDAAKLSFTFENANEPGDLIKSINKQIKNNKLNRILNWATNPEVTINTKPTNNCHDNINTKQNFHTKISSQNMTIYYKNNNNNNNRNNKNNNDNHDNSNISHASDNNENHEMDNVDDSLEDMAIESTALLRHSKNIDGMVRVNHQQQQQQMMDKNQEDCKLFEQDNDFLESSIYSEVQFPPLNNLAEMDMEAAVYVGGGVNLNGNNTNNNGSDNLDMDIDFNIDIDGDNGFTSLHNLSNASSHNSNRSTKRPKHRKHRSKSKCSATAAALIRAQRNTLGCHLTPPLPPPSLPPHYTAIYVGTNYNHCDTDLRQFNVVNVAANQSSVLTNSSVASHATTTATTTTSISAVTVTSAMTTTRGANYLHRPIMYTTMATTATATPTVAAATTAVAATTIIRTRDYHQQQRNFLPYSANFRSIHRASEISSINWSLRKWCTQPSLPFIIGVLALGGVACTLVGIVLGSTGLIGHSTQYLSAALLLIGIGVSLLVIAGAIWRLSLPDINECRCYQRMEVCRTCSSPFCENRILTGGYIYPEFQHRAPPPSYMTSLYGCNTAGLNFIVQPATIGVNTPPPVYQSTNSLRTINSINTDNNNLTNTENSTNLNNLDINQDDNVLILNAMPDNVNNPQILSEKKDFNNLE